MIVRVTFHGNATGGGIAAAPCVTFISSGAEIVCPLRLATVMMTRYASAAAYWCVTVIPLPVLPSPKSQVYVSVSPLVLVAPELKVTMSLVVAGLGTAVAAAP